MMPDPDGLLSTPRFGGVAPAISEQKARYALRQLLSTLTGGPRILPEMTVRAHLLQLAIWLLPVIPGVVAAVAIAEESGIFRLLVAGLGATTLVVCVELCKSCVYRAERQADAHGERQQNMWFRDYDEVDYSRLFSAPVCRVLFPPRCSQLHGVIALFLSFALVGVSGAVLDLKSVEQDVGADFAKPVAMLLIFKCFVAVATAQYGLTAALPVESTTHSGLCRSPLSLPALVADHSRPLLLLCLLSPLLIFPPSRAAVASDEPLSWPAGAWLRVVVAAMPTLWAIGLVPQLDTATLWVLEQSEVHLFGGSPMVHSARLFAGVVASLSAAAALTVATAVVQSYAPEEAVAAVVAVSGLTLATLLAALPPRPGNSGGRGLCCRLRRTWLEAFFACTMGLGMLLGFGLEAVDGSLHADREVGAAWLVRLALEQVACVLCFSRLWCVNSRWLGERWVQQRTRRAVDGGKPSSIDVGYIGVFAILESSVRICVLAHAACFGTVAVLGAAEKLSEAVDARSVAHLAVEVALLLRSFRVVVVDASRGAFDAWLSGAVDTVLCVASASHTDEGRGFFLQWSLCVRLLTISVARQRLLGCVARGRYAIHLALACWRLPKLRHPSVGKLLTANILLFPVAAAVVALSAALESPLLALFTLPCFVVGSPRPQHGHPELCSDGAAAVKGVEGLFYSILAPSMLDCLGPLWRRGVLDARPGSMLMWRSHERLTCLIRVLGAGVGWVEVEVRGLEMQEPTSCHHVEAGRIDDCFASVRKKMMPGGGSHNLGQRTDSRSSGPPGDSGENMVAVQAPWPLFVLKPFAWEVSATTYEQTLLSMTGLLDNEDILRQVHGLFLKTLVWVIAQRCGKDAPIPDLWLNCPLKARDAQAALNLLRMSSSSWMQRFAKLPQAVSPSSAAARSGPTGVGGSGEAEAGAEAAVVTEPYLLSLKAETAQPEPPTSPMVVSPLEPFSPPMPPDTDLSMKQPPLPQRRTNLGEKLRQLASSPDSTPRRQGSRLAWGGFRDSSAEVASGGGDTSQQASCGSTATPTAFGFDEPCGLHTGAYASEEDLDKLMDMVLDISSGAKDLHRKTSAKKPLPLVFSDAVDSEKSTVQEKGAGIRPPPTVQTTPGYELPEAVVSPAARRSKAGHGRPPLLQGGSRTENEVRNAASSSPSGPASLNFLTSLDPVTRLVVQLYVAVNIAPIYGQRPETLGAAHVLKLFDGCTGTQGGGSSPEAEWLMERRELHELTHRAFRYAVKVTVDCVAMGEDATLMKDEELDEALIELDAEWHIGFVESPQWQAAMEERRPHLLSMRRKPGSAEYQVLRLSLSDDRARVGQLRPEVVHSIWASASLELRYLTNDDDERYSIQAHPTLLRNLIVQSAEYPIYVSPPTTVWL